MCRRGSLDLSGLKTLKLESELIEVREAPSDAFKLDLQREHTMKDDSNFKFLTDQKWQVSYR